MRGRCSLPRLRSWTLGTLMACCCCLWWRSTTLMSAAPCAATPTSPYSRLDSALACVKLCMPSPVSNSAHSAAPCNAASWCPYLRSTWCRHQSLTAVSIPVSPLCRALHALTCVRLCQLCSALLCCVVPAKHTVTRHLRCSSHCT